MLRYALALCVLPILAGAQPPPNHPSVATLEAKKLFYQGADALYNYRFDEADSIHQVLQANYQDKIWTYYLAVNYYWWLCATGEDTETSRQQLRNNVQRGINLVNQEVGDKTPTHDQLYSLISMWSFKARLEVIKKKHVRAMFYMKDCVAYIEESLGQEQQYENFNLTSGMYNVNMDYAVNKWPFLKVTTWFYPEGDKAKGLEQLQQAANSTDQVLHTEGNYFLMRVYFELEEDYDDAEPYIQQLLTDYPENLFYHFTYFEILVAGKKLDAAAEQLKKIESLSQTNPHISAQQQKHFVEEGKKVLEARLPKSGLNDQTLLFQQGL